MSLRNPSRRRALSTAMSASTNGQPDVVGQCQRSGARPAFVAVHGDEVGAVAPLADFTAQLVDLRRRPDNHLETNGLARQPPNTLDEVKQRWRIVEFLEAVRGLAIHPHRNAADRGNFLA